MKLRTAYFCKMCDEELKLNHFQIERKCPHCGYKSRWGLSIIYEWKVVVKPTFKHIKV